MSDPSPKDALIASRVALQAGIDQQNREEAKNDLTPLVAAKAAMADPAFIAVLERLTAVKDDLVNEGRVNAINAMIQTSHNVAQTIDNFINEAELLGKVPDPVVQPVE